MVRQELAGHPGGSLGLLGGVAGEGDAGAIFRRRPAGGASAFDLPVELRPVDHGKRLPVRLKHAELQLTFRDEQADVGTLSGPPLGSGPALVHLLHAVTGGDLGVEARGPIGCHRCPSLVKGRQSPLVRAR